MKKVIFTMTLFVLLLASSSAYAVESTMTHTVTIEEATLAMTLSPSLTVSTIKKDLVNPFATNHQVSISNDGDIDASVYARLGSAPAGLIYNTDPDLLTAKNRVQVKAETYVLNTSTSTDLNQQLLAGNSGYFDVSFEFGANTDAATYQIPVTWELRPLP